MYVRTKDLPSSITCALSAVGYRRADINIEASETTSMRVSSGAGRRGFVVLVDIATGRTEQHTGSWGGANMFNPKNAVDLDGTERPIIPGMAVISGSEGEKVFATIYLHPENIAKLLPAKPEVTEREAQILYCMGYKSGYRRTELERMGTTPAELDSLVARGFLTRNNKAAMSLTTTGRNARRS